MRRILLVTDRTLARGRALAPLLGRAAAAGVDGVHLREKDLPDRDLRALACGIRDAVRPHGCELVVNGRFDVALDIGADGVHLPADGVPAGEVRRIAGDRLKIGVSTHSVDEALAARKAGADYVFLGPVFPTRGKTGEPLGVGPLARAAESIDLPVYAIGGIDASTAGELRGLPIAGVAVIRALLGAADIVTALEALRSSLSEAGGPGPSSGGRVTG